MKKMIIGICGLMAVVVAGCSEADKVFDCQSVCDRYKTCISDSYDVGACRNRCKEKADADKDFERKADVCEACIKDRSCTSATFNCATECSSIVP